MFFSFMAVFSSPRKSLCSARVPKGPCLRERDEAYGLSEAGEMAGCVAAVAMKSFFPRFSF